MSASHPRLTEEVEVGLEGRHDVTRVRLDARARQARHLVRVRGRVSVRARVRGRVRRVLGRVLGMVLGTVLELRSGWGWGGVGLRASGDSERVSSK